MNENDDKFYEEEPKEQKVEQEEKEEQEINGDTNESPLELDENAGADDEPIDDVEVASSDIAENDKKEPFYKNKRTLKIVSAILAVIILIAGLGGIYVMVKLNKLNKGDGDDLWEDDKIFDEIDFSTIDADLNSTGFKESIKEWATNGGEIMSSENVINVLIIGYDSRSNSFSGNTDAIMLLSLNKKTKTITLSSILRDTYVYYETNTGKSGHTKINALYSIGGTKLLMDTIGTHFKVKVDKYVAVNFKSFEKIIDEIGGIDVPVQKYEANYFDLTHKENKIATYGDSVHLNGYQALGFCRMRNCDADGDISRTRRQQTVIKAIIKKTSLATVSKLDNYLDAMLPYVTTNLKDQEIISMGTKALLMKWYSYDFQSMQIPTAESRFGYSGSTWIWAVDFPLSAQALQNALYGRTNIELTEGRKTIIDKLKGSINGTGSSSALAKPSTTEKDKDETTTTTEPIATTESIDISTTEPSVSEELTSETTEAIITTETTEAKETDTTTAAA